MSLILQKFHRDLFFFLTMVISVTACEHSDTMPNVPEIKVDVYNSLSDKFEIISTVDNSNGYVREKTRGVCYLAQGRRTAESYSNIVFTWVPCDAISKGGTKDGCGLTPSKPAPAVTATPAPIPAPLPAPVFDVEHPFGR